jgi:hypothetical protein
VARAANRADFWSAGSVSSIGVPTKEKSSAVSRKERLDSAAYFGVWSSDHAKAAAPTASVISPIITRCRRSTRR